jgi:rhodanese-related sulfurtransferase
MNGPTTRVSVADLARLLGSAAWPLVLDVRKRAALEQSGRLLPAARWHDPALLAELPLAIPAGAPVIVVCAHGHELSQAVTMLLRHRGVAARWLDGGQAAWEEARLPTIGLVAAERVSRPGRWVTRERPKVDRIACPWLLRRFVDRGAVVDYVPADQTLAVAQMLGGMAFDIEGAPLEHDGELCTFDTMIRHFAIEDPVLADLAAIVRGADTHRFDLAPQAAGLLAISLGLSHLHDDDLDQLAAGMTVYDALYRWRRDAFAETHNWPATRA